MLSLSHLPHHEPGEKVIIALHRHWFVLFKVVAFFVIVGTLPIIVRWFVIQEFPHIATSQKWMPVLVLLLSIFYLYLWVLLYRGFLDYYLDLWIVTNRRIVNIVQNDLFSRNVAEHRLEKIQDITSTQKGLLATFLDYGEVRIQTASEVPKFRFEQVPRPHRVARQINRLIQSRKRHTHRGRV